MSFAICQTRTKATMRLPWQRRAQLDVTEALAVIILIHH